PFPTRRSSDLAFAYAGCHPLHRTMPDVTGREGARDAGFGPERVALERPPLGAFALPQQLASGVDEPVLITQHYAREPIGIGLCANENGEHIRRHSFKLSGVRAANGERFQML